MMNPIHPTGRTRIALVTGAAAVLCLAAACSSKEAAPDASSATAQSSEVVEEHFTDPVAVVNGKGIYQSTYDQILIAMRDKIPDNRPDGVEAYIGAKYEALEKAIDEELLYQEAVRRGYGLSDAEVQKLFDGAASKAGGEEAYLQRALLQHLSKSEIIEGIRRTKAIGRFVKEDVEKGLTASEDQVRAYYDARPDLFTPDPWVGLGQIFVSAPIQLPEDQRARALSRISAALDRVHKGEPFERVARDVSEETAAESGGKLGLFKKGNLPPELDKAAFSLPVGGISGILETDKGYHILRVYERKGGQLEPYEKVKDRVRDALMRKLRSDKLNSLIATLRDSAKIERLLT